MSVLGQSPPLFTYSEFTLAGISKSSSLLYLEEPHRLASLHYSTVTDLAKLRGLSTSRPLARAI